MDWCRVYDIHVKVGVGVQVGILAYRRWDGFVGIGVITMV